MHGPYPATANRRRWLSFRLSTLLLVVTAAAVVFGQPHLRRQNYFRRLKQFAGQDIRQLPDSERSDFFFLVSGLLNEKRRSRQLFREHWFLWELQTDHGKRYILLSRDLSFSVPDEATTYTHAFDFSGRVAGAWTFSAGWRLWPQSAVVVTDKLPGESLIRIDTAPHIDGADIARQYYAFIGGNLVLVRLEDSDGKCVVNDYAAPNHTIGPETNKVSKNGFVLFPVPAMRRCCRRWSGSAGTIAAP